MEIKVLTYNLWGIFNSKNRKERMEKFATKVANYDVILLQEQFSAEDFSLIEKKLPPSAKGKYYFRRFPSSFIGSGCAVISRYPIRSALFHVYPLQGYPEMVLHGDYYANKGAALVKIDVPLAGVEGSALVNRTVHLYTTHLVACYQKVSELVNWRAERYLPYRISQSISLANFIVNTSAPSDYVIIGGDFNSSQRSLEVQTMLIILKRAGFSMRSVLPTPSYFIEEGADPSPQHRESQARSTYTYSLKNAYNASKTSYFKVLGLEADMPSQIDHIFYSGNNFALRLYDDCPDIKEGYSPTVKDEAGADCPCGLIVHTRNEVPVVVKPSLRSRLAVALFRCREHAPPQSMMRRLTQRTATWLLPTVSQQSMKRGPDYVYFPMSDHYGVSAKLRSRDVASPSYAGLSSLELSEDEANVIANVIEYLDSFSDRMRRQITIAHYIGVVSLLTVGLNVLLLRHSMKNQELRVALGCRMLCELGSKSGAGKQKMQKGLAAQALESLRLPFVSSNNEKAVEQTTKEISAMENVDYALLARELCGRSLWNSAETSAIVTIVGSLAGVLSLAISVLNRTATVKIMSDQVQQVRAI